MGAATRNDAIDVLRGISIILVVLFHIQLRLPVDQTVIGQFLPQEIVSPLFRSGYYGVIVFFVISGFLITTTSLRRWGELERMRTGRFYRLRFARIAPCFIALLFLLSMLHLLGIEGFTITSISLGRAAFAAATFHLNWLEAATGYLPGAWDVLWSLSVEEAFYLAFPLLCLLARDRRVFILTMLGFVILGPFARVAFTDNEIWADKSYLAGADGLAFGCLAAYAVHSLRIGRAASRISLIAGLALFLLAFVFRRQTLQLGLTGLGLNVTVLEMGVALTLVALRDQSFAAGSWRSFLTAPVRWFGRNSYEIYLTHMLVVTLLAPALILASPPTNPLPLYAGLLLLSGLLGGIVARFFSEPMNRTLRSGHLPLAAAPGQGLE